MKNVAPLTNLPVELASLTQGAAWYQNQVGLSGTEVYQLNYETETLYLKVATGFQAGELDLETQRLQWMQGRLPVPEIRFSGVDSDRRYLLMTQVPGLMSFDSDLPLSQEKIIIKLAEGVRMFHQLDVSDCPFDTSLDWRFVSIRQKLVDGIMDEDLDVLEPLLDRLENNPPKTEERVFTHGDYCLPNIMIDPQSGAITGFIDLSRAGVCDPHQDIALCMRSLAYNFGEEWVPLLVDAYGRSDVDPEKVEYYQQIDRFFW